MLCLTICTAGFYPSFSWLGWYLSITLPDLWHISYSFWFLEDHQLWVENTLVCPFNTPGNNAPRNMKLLKEQRCSPNTSLLYLASLAEEHGTCVLLVKVLPPSGWRKLSSSTKFIVSERKSIEQLRRTGEIIYYFK